ncbi:TPA: MucBP domain-containing protein, partial [Listeria monocytogenes]|nr:MucBP domain-containing protein [Listeria monocytogenes]
CNMWIKEGKEVHASQTIGGNVGESYDATTTAYKLSIDGYSLDTTKLPSNAVGELSSQAQLITYVYTKEAEDAKVTVKFVDQNGNPFVLNNLMTYAEGALVPLYPNLDQYQGVLDYNQQLYKLGQPIPDMVLPTKEGETYSLPETMMFKIINDQGNILPFGVMTNDIKYIDKDTGDMGIMDWRTANVSANREGTLGSEDIVVTYTMYPMC